MSKNGVIFEQKYRLQKKYPKKSSPKLMKNVSRLDYFTNDSAISVFRIASSRSLRKGRLIAEF